MPRLCKNSFDRSKGFKVDSVKVLAAFLNEPLGVVAKMRAGKAASFLNVSSSNLVLTALIRRHAVIENPRDVGKGVEATVSKQICPPELSTRNLVLTLWFARIVAHVGCLTVIRRSNGPVMARRKILECRSNHSSFFPSRRPSLFFRPSFRSP